MKKITLLAASVAVALTGCGGGSSSSDSTGGTAPSGTTITAFDGYFKNAVVFVDKDNDGVWDLPGDTFVGLTDTNGQVTLSNNITIADGESLAVQTVTPSGAAIDKLLDIDRELYAGTYTVDMDAPSQPMEHELVFRAPHKSDVISPITDLVAMEYKETGNLDTAEQTIVAILGDGQEVDLYSDFVEGSEADAAMHKTAQIITESKASAESNGTTYTAEVAKKVADEADNTVDSITDETLLEDDTFKPVVPVAGDGTVTPIPDTEVSTPDYKTTVNSVVLKEIQDKLDKLDLTFGDAGSSDYFLTVDINNLFSDKNIADDETFIEIAGIKVYDGEELQAGNVELVLHLDTGKLNIGVNPSKTIKTAGEFTFSLVSGNSEKTNSTEATFTVKINEGDAKAPEVTSILDNMKDTISQWELVEGEAIDDESSIYTVSYTGLFDSDNDLIIYHQTNLHSNALELEMREGEVLKLFGTPAKSSEDTGLDYKIWITAEDQETGLETTVTINVPEIAEEPEPDLHPLVGKTLYIIENETLWSNDFSGPRPDGLAYCQSMLLAEDGNVYWNKEESTSDCPEVDKSSADGTWETDSKGEITVTESDDFQIAYKLSDEFNSFTGNAIYQVDDLEIEIDYSDTFMAFTSQTDAARQLNTLSTANCSEETDTCPRGFEMVLPSSTETDGKYDKNVLGTVSLSLEYNDNNDTGTMDADITFDLPSDLESCEYLNTHFESFWITGTDVNNATFLHPSTECSDGKVGDNSANFDFDFSTEIKPDSTVSFIAFAKDDNDEKVNDVTMSLIWDGYNK